VGPWHRRTRPPSCPSSRRPPGMVLTFCSQTDRYVPIGPEVALPGPFREPSTVVSGRDLSFQAPMIGIHYVSIDWAFCEKITCLKIEGFAPPSKNKRLPSAQLFGVHFLRRVQFIRNLSVLEAAESSNLLNPPIASSDSNVQRCCHDRFFLWVS